MQALFISSYIIDNPLICVWWEEVGLLVSYKWKIINNLCKSVTILYIASASARSADAIKHVSYPLVAQGISCSHEFLLQSMINILFFHFGLGVFWGGFFFNFKDRTIDFKGIS